MACVLFMCIVAIEYVSPSSTSSLSSLSSLPSLPSMAAAFVDKESLRTTMMPKQSNEIPVMSSPNNGEEVDAHVLIQSQPLFI